MKNKHCQILDALLEDVQAGCSHPFEVRMDKADGAPAQPKRNGTVEFWGPGIQLDIKAAGA